MKNYLYNLIINSVTDYCYQNCLEYVSENASILDVGIGNGVMMNNFHSLIKSKNLNITGIDIDRHYLNRCESIIRNYNLQDHVEIHCKPVEDYEPSKDCRFDFILFTMSFMLFKDQEMVLDRIKSWLKPGGEIVFFQTMFKEKVGILELIKPKLKYVTTVDFGRVTYEDDFFALLKSKQLSITEDRLIERKKWFKGEYRMLATTINGCSDAGAGNPH